MKVFKIEMFTCDEELQDPKEIKDIIEGQKYPNHCLNPDVMSVEGVDIGEWDDDNPLNCWDTQRVEYERLFPKIKQRTMEELQKQFYSEMIKEGVNPALLNTVKGEYLSKKIAVLWELWLKCARANGILKE